MPQFIKPSKGETVSPPTQSRPKPERTTVQKPVHTTHKLYYGTYLNKTVYKHIFHSEILKMLSVSTFYLMFTVSLLVKTTFLFEVDQLFLYSRSQNFSFQCLTDTSYSTIYCLDFVIFQISAIITLCSFFIFGFFLVFPLGSLNLSFQVVKFLVYSKHQCYLHLMLRFIRIGKSSLHLMGIHSKIFPFVLFSSFIILIYCQFHPCNVQFISLFPIDLLPITVSQLRPKAQQIYAELDAFMEEKVYPVEKEILTERTGEERWQPHPKLEELKA